MFSYYRQITLLHTFIKYFSLARLFAEHVSMESKLMGRVEYLESRLRVCSSSIQEESPPKEAEGDGALAISDQTQLL